MREVKPTQKPVPSSDVKDLFFNSGKIDEWVNSLQHEYTDRFGKCHKTAAGMEWVFNQLIERFKIESEQALLAAGYAPAGTFQEGAEVVSRNGTVLWKLPDGDGDHYRWDGDLPKKVPAGSTPQSTGDIGKGAWVSVGDASLRWDVKNGDGSLIGIGGGETLKNAITWLNIKQLGAIGDGVTDDSLVFSELNDGIYYVPDGDYLINNTSVSRGVTLSFSDNAKLTSGDGISNIYGIINSNNCPVDLSSIGNIRIHPYTMEVGEGKEFEKIQSAIDKVPSNMWQRFYINVYKGNYVEDLLTYNKNACSANLQNDDSLPGEHTGIFIIGKEDDASKVRINSALFVSCKGATFTPQIHKIQIDGYVEKTNEKTSIEFYGCPAGATTQIKYRATNASKALMSYSSFISEESCDYGDNLYDYAYCTKHSGVISVNGLTDLLSLKSSFGILRRKIALIVSGHINAADMSNFKYGEMQPYKVYGVGTGFVNEMYHQRFHGAALHADNPSPIQHYFTPESFDTAFSGGTATYSASEGTKITALSNQYANIFRRRIASISAKNIHQTSSIQIGARLESISNDAHIKFGIGWGVGSPKLYFEVSGGKVYGVYENTSNIANRVEITTLSNILNKACVFSIETIMTGDIQQQGGARAISTFKVLDRNYNGYKVFVPVTETAITDYDWNIYATGGLSGAVVMTFAEMRLFRYPLISAS